MGMFDYADLSEYNLPNLRKRNYPKEWQTKDLGCNLDHYRMDKKGILYLGRNLATVSIKFYGDPYSSYKFTYNLSDLISVEKT